MQVGGGRILELERGIKELKNDKELAKLRTKYALISKNQSLSLPALYELGYASNNPIIGFGETYQMKIIKPIAVNFFAFYYHSTSRQYLPFSNYRINNTLYETTEFKDDTNKQINFVNVKLRSGHTFSLAGASPEYSNATYFYFLEEWEG